MRAGRRAARGDRARALRPGGRTLSGTVAVRHADGLTPAEVDTLAEVLVAVVDGGASVGFLPPLDLDAARAYWRRVAEGAAGGSPVLLLAEIDGQVVGTAQVHPAESANGRHRGEVAKVLVHPDWQRRGIGRALMAAVERAALADGRTLLVLDTREGDPSNALYLSAGWTEAGRVPRWARAADGTLKGTVFYYKELSPEG